jgi:hypothetical protein
MKKIHKIHTVYADDKKYPNVGVYHPVVEVTFAEGEAPKAYCGDTHCRGKCGMTAAIIPATEETSELKMRSSMVAYGAVMQPWEHKDWQGTKEEIPEEYRESLRKLYWVLNKKPCYR